MSWTIRAESLGKQYVINGVRQANHYGLRDAIAGGARAFLARRAAARHREAFWALRDIDLQIRSGERVGIIGPNGAGKSTLLKIFSRLTEPSAGEVRIRGRLASLLEVNTGFHPELTGRENVFIKGAIHGMSRRDISRRFDEIVAFSGVERFLDTPVKRYSSGMYVRLAFAVAAHLEPDILVVDEVLAVGDAAFQQRCLGKMKESASEGRTVIFVSHNLPAVRSLCRRAVLLTRGRIVVDGSVDEAVEAYWGTLTQVTAERIWPEHAAPGNRLFRLATSRVRGADGAVSGRLPNDEDLSIEIEYAVLTPGIRMGATVVLYDAEGTGVFSSISNHEPHWHDRGRPAGRYRSVCRVPGDLLRDGSYRATIILWGGGYTDAVVAEEALTFEIFDTGSLRGDFFGKQEGVIAPRLEWQCIREADASNPVGPPAAQRQPWLQTEGAGH